MKPQHRLLALCVIAFASACSDVPITQPSPGPTAVAFNRIDALERYVAIGTSISMGWASNGVYAASQEVSWPSLLAFGTAHAIRLPLIESPGCTSPLVAPLGAGLRLSGESAAGSTVCAPNEAGVTLPTQNVGIAGALAVDAVTKTPGATTPPWYARVLPTGHTQLTAALSQQPTIVSVELGGNEVLGVTTGLFAPGVTIVPFPFFAQPLNALLNAVGSTQAKAVVFEMPTDAANLPALRLGDEIWANRDEFAELHVDVSSDCEASPNYINVSVKSLNIVFEAAFRHANGLPNPVFSCADLPGTADLVITPADIAAANALLAQMRAYVEEQAAARGYALASLSALYDRPDLKRIPYSVVDHLTSSRPFGPLFSLDGVHPSAIGHTMLAVEAARAINSTYGATLARAAASASVLASNDGMERLVTSRAVALELAKGVAAAHRGLQLSPCVMPGECKVAAPRR